MIQTMSSLEEDQNRARRQGTRLFLGRGKAFGSLTVFQTVEVDRRGGRALEDGSL